MDQDNVIVMPTPEAIDPLTSLLRDGARKLIAQAVEAEQRAQKAMQDAKTDIEFAKAKAELAQQMAQLRAIKKLRKR